MVLNEKLPLLSMTFSVFVDGNGEMSMLSFSWMRIGKWQLCP